MAAMPSPVQADNLGSGRLHQAGAVGSGFDTTQSNAG